MNDLITFLLIAAGVAISVVYPAIWGKVRKAFPEVAGASLWRRPWVQKYTLLLVFSLITAFIAFAIYRSANPHAKITWYAAVILGIGWEAIIEKAVAVPKKLTVGSLPPSTPTASTPVSSG
jgi:uncharacterized BrkB/YihY/UPF0761 family membrane protein